MRRKRQKHMFDKTNSILTELVGNKQDKCFLTKGRRWLLVGLTKQTRLRKAKYLWQNAGENPKPLMLEAAYAFKAAVAGRGS